MRDVPTTLRPETERDAERKPPMSAHCCNVETGCAELPDPCTCACDGCRNHAASPGSDDELRDIFARLNRFVVSATANLDDKNDALQCIEVLQSRFL